MEGHNKINVAIYSSGSTPINDPGQELALAEQIRFSTVYPGGIFADASFVIPRDVTRALPFKHGQRVVIRNGLQLVWEGWIADIGYDFGRREQVVVNCLGYVAIWYNRYKYNRIVDRRFGSHIFGVWDQLDAQANDKCTLDRTDRLRLEPKQEAWALNEFAFLRWDGNAGSNAKRVKFGFELQEGAQAWELELFDFANSVSLWSTTVSGTGTQDITLTTSSPQIEFRLYSRAAQTPTGSAIFGEITNLRVLCENASGAITTTVEAILKAYINYSGGTFSSSTALIAANTYDLESAGITSDDLNESIGAFFNRVGQFSATDEPYSAGIRESESVAGETKPVIYYEKQPLLSDYDYVIGIGDQNLAGSGQLVASAYPDTLKTWVLVVFRDNRGREQWDFANRDTTLGTKYIERTLVTRAGSGVTTLAAAADYGATILNDKKNLQYYMNGPLSVKGYLLSKQQEEVPISQVRAGKRLKIANFLADFGDATAGSGFTFLIQRAEYSDQDETVSLTLGRPVDLTSVVASALREQEGALTR